MRSNFQYTGLIKPDIIASLIKPLMTLYCDCVDALGKSNRQIRTNNAEIPIGNRTFNSISLKKENVTKAPMIAVHNMSAAISLDFE